MPRDMDQWIRNHGLGDLLAGVDGQTMQVRLAMAVDLVNGVQEQLEQRNERIAKALVSADYILRQVMATSPVILEGQAHD